MKTEPQSLPFHEWLIVTLIIALMLCLTLVTYVQKDNAPPETKGTQELISPYIQVSVQGGVENPGDYTLKKGAPLGELLDLVKPLPGANLKGLRRNKKLRDGQHIYVSMKPLITIYIEGAVERPQAIQVVKGTRLNEIQDKIVLQADADTKILQKKRLLKDKEIITIPIIQIVSTDNT